MCGVPVTSGLSKKRKSRSAFCTTKVSGVRIAWPQKETLRGVEPASRPTRALNHCRSPSSSDTRAMGTRNTWAAVRTMRSKRSSAGVSSRHSPWSAWRRRGSSGGRGGAIIHRQAYPVCSRSGDFAPLRGTGPGGPQSERTTNDNAPCQKCPRRLRGKWPQGAPGYRGMKRRVAFSALRACVVPSGGGARYSRRRHASPVHGES